MYFRYGDTTVEIFEPSPITNGCVRTTLPDGSVVLGAPIEGEEHEARAASLGYPGIWEMTAEHDRIHVLLCYMLGLPESPTLRASFLGHPTSELIGAEESAVLAIQRFINEYRKEFKCALPNRT